MRATDEIWRRLLPNCLEISVGWSAMSPLRVDEEAETTFGDRRRLEFSAGRAHARAALTRLGFNDVMLPVGKQGGPIWPKGTTGSITHATDDRRSYIAAVVGRSTTLQGIGIDVEFVATFQPSMWSQFLTQRELDYIRKLPIDSRIRAIAAIWCAKEAAIKAVGQVLEPSSIEVVRRQAEDDLVQVWSVKRLSVPAHHEPLEARTASCGGLAIAAVTLPKLRIDARVSQSTIGTEGKSSGLGY